MTTQKSAQLVAVLAGKVRDFPATEEPGHFGRPWRSAFIKEALTGTVQVRRLGLEGDEVADTKVHGGLEQSVLAYPYEHYQRWRSESGVEEMGPGGFGENLCIDGLDESSVCIGDSYKIGTVLLQVSLPRLPCSSIDRRWRRKGLMKQVGEFSRTGWYFRVLQEGKLAASDPVFRTARPLPQWTVKRVLQLRLNNDEESLNQVTELAECDLLAPHWREHFAQRASRHVLSQ